MAVEWCTTQPGPTCSKWAFDGVTRTDRALTYRPSTVPPASRHLVLIVEDHPDTQSALAEVFEQNGYETVVASDGDAGLRIVREKHPALVCLDLHLPRISGHEVCEQIRKDPSLSDVAFG